MVRLEVPAVVILRLEKLVVPMLRDTCSGKVRAKSRTGVRGDCASPLRLF